jgi:hypothetical protein
MISLLNLTIYSMKDITNQPKTTVSEAEASRRSFLRVAGAAAVTGGLLSACSNADQSVSPNGARAAAAGDVITLPGGDLGILNYAYVLEQLEAAFYEMVLARPYLNMSSSDRQLLQDIRDHEVIHRDFFKTALGSNAIPALTFDFSSINFGLRPTVLKAAQDFEDTGVGAYNGAGKYLTNSAYLTIAGQIVSVEARHSSIIRELEYPNQDAFAGPTIVTGPGLHLAYEPSQVLPIAQSFIRETIDARNLPMRTA